MDPGSPSPSARKVKFAPKKPPRRSTRISNTKIEEDGGEDNESKQFLARTEHLARRGGKVEKKSPVQVTFSHGVPSNTIRSFGRQRERSDDESKRIDDGSIVAYSEATTTGEMHDPFTSISAAETQGISDDTVDLTDAAIVKKKKEYREPWDYHHSYYPTTLPLRRPYSGNPELCDKAEFEEAPDEYDENSLSAASHLGLLDQDDTARMLLFMFPSNLPLGRQPTNANRRETCDNLKALENSVKSGKGKEKVMVGSVAKASGISNGKKEKEIAGSSMALMSGNSLKKDVIFEKLHEGYMGKMLVYKSGAVKLKLGDVLYDVSPGSECSFSEKVMAINPTDKQCCELGEGNKRALVTPDIDSLLNRQTD